MAVKYRVDGVEYEVSEQAKQALERDEVKRADALKAKEAEVAAARAEADKSKARVDALAEELTKKDAELKAAPEKVRASIQARVDLEAKARDVLGKETKLDGLDDAAVKRAVLAKLSPNLKLDGQSEAYIDARFDVALELHGQGNHALAAARAAAAGTSHTDAAPSSPAEARARMLEWNRQAAQPKKTA